MADELNSLIVRLRSLLHIDDDRLDNLGRSLPRSLSRFVDQRHRKGSKPLDLCHLDGAAVCNLDRPLLGEFYSYENGLETHSSFKENGDIERRFYRRESGAGATRKDTGGLLVNEDIGECFQLSQRDNHFQLIYRDKCVALSLVVASFISLFLRRSQSCFQCYQMFNRTRNILQLRKSTCSFF